MSLRTLRGVIWIHKVDKKFLSDIPARCSVSLFCSGWEKYHNTSSHSRNLTTARQNQSIFTMPITDYFKKKDGSKYSTRVASIEAERAKFLSMSKEEKRQFYKGKNINELTDVPTWQEYFCQDRQRLEKLKSKSPSRSFEVDEELNKRVSIWKGDITTLEIDSIVNAANNSLLGGGGVDGAIHRAAGSQLKAECATLGGCETGDAKITCAYKLPAKHVIHTVGPIGENRDKLHSCYSTCLKIVNKNKLTAVAFPCISTGIYGYSNVKAAPVVLNTAREWLVKQRHEEFERIIFCLFLPKDVELYETLMQEFFPVGAAPASQPRPEAAEAGETAPADEGQEAPAAEGGEKTAAEGQEVTAAEGSETAAVGGETAAAEDVETTAAEGVETAAAEGEAAPAVAAPAAGDGETEAAKLSGDEKGAAEENAEADASSPSHSPKPKRQQRESAPTEKAAGE